MNDDAHIDIHPDHPVDGEVVKGIQAYREELWHRDDDAFELARLARPTPRERQFQAQLREAELRSAGIDVEAFHATRSALRKEALDRWLKHDYSAARPLSGHLKLDRRPLAPLATDPNFWWAQSNLFGNEPYTGSFDADGVSFRGMKNHDDGDLIKLRFGLTAIYELQADRIPFSGSGRWRSAPFLEIFGQLIGSSQDSFGFGDDWCKCWMIRRQTAYQFVFAPPGVDNRHIIGDRTDVQTIFFSEDAPFTAFWRGPGFQPLPALEITHPFPAQSIFVETEVRFDIQLEGSAELWIDPQQRFVIRGFQWPAEPI